MLERGFIHLYFGEGKGKTTSAIGLSIRALGAGLKVAFLQFFKPGNSSEVKILKNFYPHLLYAFFHSGSFVRGKNINEELVKKIHEGYAFFKEILFQKNYDLIVLDEVLFALNWNIIDLDEFLEVLKNKPLEIEIVITGREAPKPLIEVAHLVTEMKMIKHYFKEGVKARWGIEK